MASVAAGYLPVVTLLGLDDRNPSSVVGSLAAALMATVVLRLRNRTYRKLYDAERVDHNRDDIPDVYQH